VTEHGISSRTEDVRERVACDIERMYRSRAAQGKFPPVLRYGGSCLMSPL